MVSRRIFLTGLAGAAATAAAAYMFFLQPKTTISSSEPEVEVVARKLNVPWSMTFLNNDEAVFTERNGALNLLSLSSGRVENVAQLDVTAVGEGGLLGVEHLPSGKNQMLFLYYTYSEQGMIYNKVVRAKLSGGLDDVVEIISRIPGGRIHNGGRIKIGPDKHLYITTGEAGDTNLSQRTDSLGGKILRITTDGKIPVDNPFQNPVYAYGLRNPQGIAWHPENGRLYSTDHGPSGEGLRRAHDEVNLIRPGENYGWPFVIGDEERPGMKKPVYHSGTETWAPSGCCFYSGRRNNDYRNSFFFACLRGSHLHRVVFGPDGESVATAQKLFQDRFGRLRDVVEAPDGALYLLTSNRDGRGTPVAEDDRIIRIIF